MPALGLLFIFLCIVSKGFRNFIVGLIILSVLFFEGAWFYSHFYRTDEEKAEFKAKVIQVFGKEEKEKREHVGRVEIIEREEKRERADVVEKVKEVEKKKEREKKLEPEKKKDPPTPVPTRPPVPTRTPIRFLLKDRKR